MLVHIYCEEQRLYSSQPLHLVVLLKIIHLIFVCLNNFVRAYAWRGWKPCNLIGCVVHVTALGGPSLYFVCKH